MCRLLAILLGLACMILPTKIDGKSSKVLKFVSSKWAAKIKPHLVEIENRGWGQIVPGDLYHGHLILSGQRHHPEVFSSLDELFEHSALILYHSDEMLQRWLGDQGDRPVEKRTPRSIVGYWDGRIVQADSMVQNPVEKTPHFLSSGTIHSDDLAANHQGTLELRRDRAVKHDGGVCSVNLIVDISITVADPSRANMNIGERKYNLTMDCAR